jgi:hypothetical protein
MHRHGYKGTKFHRERDNAELARVSFVDDLKEAPVAKAAAKPKVEAKPATKPAVKATAKEAK